MARVAYRGKVNRRLRGLDLPAPVAPGATVRLQGRDVGVVTSSAVSPRLGPIALAMIRSEAAPGTPRRGRRRWPGRPPWSSCPLQIHCIGRSKNPSPDPSYSQMGSRFAAPAPPNQEVFMRLRSRILLTAGLACLSTAVRGRRRAGSRRRPQVEVRKVLEARPRGPQGRGAGCDHGADGGLDHGLGGPGRPGGPGRLRAAQRRYPGRGDDRPRLDVRDPGRDPT